MTRFFKRHWQSLTFWGGATLANNPAWSVVLVGLMLCAFLSISVVAFTPSYIHSFLTDDYKQLSFIQPFLDKPYTLYQAFNPYFLGWYYRPTQLVFFTLFRLAFGTNPLPYYAGLLLLHAVNIVLVYQVVRIWGNGRLGAICAAGPFSVIATHQEVVGWISAVSILLAAAFALLTLYQLRAYLNAPQHTKRLITALLMAVLAILSREEAVTLYPLILVIWLFLSRRRPRQLEIGLLAGLGLLVVAYSVIVFLRPTWTPHAHALLDRNWADLASLQNLSRFFLKISDSYLSIENIPNDAGGLTTSLMLGMMLLAGVAFFRGNSLLRLGLLWTGALLLFLYSVVWLFTGNIELRYLYLLWLSISLCAGAVADQLRRKYRGRHVVPIIALLALMGNFLYQTPLSRQLQQRWQHDADLTAHNAAQIKKLVPEVTAHTHFFAYDMPPVTDYIQAMAAVWYDTPLEGRGGYWKRLMNSGFATPNDYLFNYEEGVVYNVMPELQESEKTIFVWQENPVAELVQLDGARTLLAPGNYQLNQIVGPPGQKRFGFLMDPPNPEAGWASLAYTTTVPDQSNLTFGIRQDGRPVDGEKGLTFRVNIVDNADEQQTIYQTSTLTEAWTELSLPMDDYWKQTILLQFQIQANTRLMHDRGYWANPRLVVDTSD
jgi:hypothetical protein